MISGMHGNPNFSGEALGKAVQSVEDSFNEAIAALYGRIDDDEADKPLTENPFFASMKLPEIESQETYKVKGLPFEIERDPGA